jgi:hypothetical protein
MTVAFWTRADQAEQDVLLWAVVDGWHRHRRTCDLEPCPHLQAAIREICDWREARILLSRAQALRVAQEVEQAA